jgi:hypothetical protein
MRTGAVERDLALDSPPPLLEGEKTSHEAIVLALHRRVMMRKVTQGQCHTRRASHTEGKREEADDPHQNKDLKTLRAKEAQYATISLV